MSEKLSKPKPAPKVKGRWYLWLLILILLPGYPLWITSGGAAEAKEAGKQLIEAGGGFKETFASIKKAFKEGGFDAVKEQLEAAPELAMGLLLQKAVAADDELRAAVRAGIVRSSKSEALTALERRFVLDNLPGGE